MKTLAALPVKILGLILGVILIWALVDPVAAADAAAYVISAIARFIVALIEQTFGIDINLPSDVTEESR